MYILGPCAAESREQVMETAQALVATTGFGKREDGIPFVYRAGVWKPRTSPYSFQGVGAEGLAWLQEVQRTFGLPVATEVATQEHVRQAMEAGIDYLWIGARTSASPIAVEAIATQIKEEQAKSKHHSLQGVLVKNPVNADADLWIGNIARLEKTGVPVIAVHRGCNHQPCWSMAHKVRLARPDIPMLLDPSHMSGDAARVPELMAQGMELGLDGSMVEVHPHPEAALSDRNQQLTPTCIGNALDSILSRLCLVSLICPHDGQEELHWLRAEIDELDNRIWDSLAARMEVSKRIGAWKKAHGVAPLQPERYQQIVEKLRVKNENLKMNGSAFSEDFMLRIWELIHAESLHKQE